MPKKELTLTSPLEDLLVRKSKTLDKLLGANIKTIYDLLWIFPLKVEDLPPLQDFSKIIEDSYFSGLGKVINIQSRPNFRSRGKGRALLHNVSVVVQDYLGSSTINLKWFNCYSSMLNKLKALDHLSFQGEVTSFQGICQIVSPKIEEISFSNLQEFSEIEKNRPVQKLVNYPTVNGISPTHLKKIMDKIPDYIWDSIEDPIPQELLHKRKLINIKDAFLFLHGKKVNAEVDIEKAHKRIIYQEFFEEQIKIQIRKDKNILEKGVSISNINTPVKSYEKLFPYQFTEDQIKTINDISKDLTSGPPMMRMIQGDVGSGKTTVAIVSSLMIIEASLQVALMCPTESLAFQHFKTISKIYPKVRILLGSTSLKEKRQILKGLEEGSISFIVGTHSLFQDSVNFKNLALAIIDEQHKFGVNQRLKLLNKNKGTHCLTMSATPIPRSLGITLYGDLDISIIKSMPKNRKGHKTRIVSSENWPKFLSFVKTRLELGEQIYIVVPAIKETINADLVYLNQVLEKFQKIFHEYKVEGLHGQMKNDEKENIFLRFSQNKINLLVATSVIEVGIDIPNATVMAIMNPERFGLSSLHQLRGRIGRGEKPGFCFLIADKVTERLKVIENHSDGFLIAEEDLKIRGEGDLFGTVQSGDASRKMANIIRHESELSMAREDIQFLNENDQLLGLPLYKNLEQKDHILKTI